MKKERKMTKVAPMYVYATEMVAEYYRRLGLAGKRVLTVAGSGDQVINALYFGAREVAGFDINRNALFITELKIAAIRILSYQEFIRFFSQTKKGFDHALYVKAQPLLTSACRKYFDRVYTTLGRYELGTSEYFRNRTFLVNSKKAREVNAYLADAIAYRKMKDILEHIRPTLYRENVLTLAKNKKLSGKKFDVINLSNIPNYLTGRSFGLTEPETVVYFRRLKKLVMHEGCIFFYSFDDAVYPNPHAKDIPPLSRTAFLIKLKRSGAFRISKKSFPGITKGTTDRITLLGC